MFSSIFFEKTSKFEKSGVDGGFCKVHMDQILVHMVHNLQSFIWTLQNSPLNPNQHNDIQFNNKLNLTLSIMAVLLSWVSFILSAVYAECHKQTNLYELFDTECCCTKCPNTNCFVTSAWCVWSFLISGSPILDTDYLLQFNKPSMGHFYFRGFTSLTRIIYDPPENQWLIQSYK